MTCDLDCLFIKHQNNQLVLHCTDTDTDDSNLYTIWLELTHIIPTLSFIHSTISGLPPYDLIEKSDFFPGNSKFSLAQKR